jgi:phosphoglycerate dehydrogenase-like enzyme
MKIVIAEPISTTLNELISQYGKDWIVFDDRPADKAEFIARIGDAEAASSYSVHYDDEVFTACPNLKYVAIPAVGASFFVDMEAAKRHGVTVMNCPGYNAQAVAELAVGLLLDVMRQITRQHQVIQEGEWSVEPPATHLLGGKNIGLVGYGNVGKTIERLLSGWNVKVTYINSESTADDADLLVKDADCIIVCCPITEQTRDLIDERRIVLMKPEAVVVNVGRGGVINEDALYESLVAGKIAGAGLDVFDAEPDNSFAAPERITRLAKLPNVVCTPHMAGTSEESRVVLGKMIYENLESCVGDKPLNVYNSF